MSQAFGTHIHLCPIAAAIFLSLHFDAAVESKANGIGINPKQMLGSSDSFISIVDDVFGATSIAIYFHLGDRFRLLPLCFLFWVK